jgi:ApaG protein
MCQKFYTQCWIRWICAVCLLSAGFVSPWSLCPTVCRGGLARPSKLQKAHINLRIHCASGENLIKERNELWKSISSLEKEAVALASSNDGNKLIESCKLFSKSIALKKTDPFIALAEDYNNAMERHDDIESSRLLAAMSLAGLPPHLASLISKPKEHTASFPNIGEDVDPGSTFSDTVTDKVRVKVNSFYDSEKSDPTDGKYMFWYKVAIFNEGPEPIQLVSRMWEISKCTGEVETVQGAGVMSTQPIIAPGDVFTYKSVCPLKVFPPKGKRVVGSMNGAYTMCKGNMGQHNLTVKIGAFNLLVPESVAKV